LVSLAWRDAASISVTSLEPTLKTYTVSGSGLVSAVVAAAVVGDAWVGFATNAGVGTVG
jgi:hypothetical protein